MKVYAECSRIDIWVPTKENKYYNASKNTISPDVGNGNCKKKKNKLTIPDDGSRKYSNNELKVDDAPTHDRKMSDQSAIIDIAKSEVERLREIEAENKGFEEILLELANELHEIPRILRSYDGNFLQFGFYVENYMVEDLLLKLQEKGIGSREYTSVSVIPASTHLEVAPENDNKRYFSKATLSTRFF